MAIIAARDPIAISTFGILMSDALLPAESDVRDGTLFGPVGEYEGTLEVAGGDTPTTPTVTSATSTTTVTLTIDSDAGVTNYAVYKGAGDISWQAGGNRSGDGDIEIAGLDYNVSYVFVVYSESAGGDISLPSIAIQTTLTETGITGINEADVIDIISEHDETLTIYRATSTYGNSGMASQSWASQGTFLGHWQPASGKTERAEEGRKIKSEAFIIAPNTASGAEDDKITRASGETMYVNYIKKYAGHQTIFLKKTAGQN